MKIELWPAGHAPRATEIGRAALINLGRIPVGEEHAYLSILRDDTGLEHVAHLRHERAQGFWPLLAQAAASPATSGSQELPAEVIGPLVSHMYDDCPQLER